MIEQQYIALLNKYRNSNRTVKKNLNENTQEDGLLYSSLDEYLRLANKFKPSSITFEYLYIDQMSKISIFNKDYKKQLYGMVLGSLATRNEDLLFFVLYNLYNELKTLNWKDKKEFLDKETINLILLSLSYVSPTLKAILFIPTVVSTYLNVKHKNTIFSFITSTCFKLVYKFKMPSKEDNVNNIFKELFGESHPFFILINTSNKY